MVRVLGSPIRSITYGFTAWGLTMAAYRIKMPVQEYWPELFKYLFGAFILRSATCTVNDILDRDLDASVGKHRLN
jgi:4-hydroxybenzoate polyprenyltransferase